MKNGTINPDRINPAIFAIANPSTLLFENEKTIKEKIKLIKLSKKHDTTRMRNDHDSRAKIKTTAIEISQVKNRGIETRACR